MSLEGRWKAVTPSLIVRKCWNMVLRAPRCFHFGGKKIMSKFECVWWYYKIHKATRYLLRETPISVISAKFQHLCTYEGLEQSNWVSTFTVYLMWHWWWTVWWCKGQSYICLRNLQAEFHLCECWEGGRREVQRKTNASWTLSFFAFIYHQIFLWCDQPSFINFALSLWHFVSRKWLSCHIWELERAKGCKSLFYLSSYPITAECLCRHAFPLAYTHTPWAGPRLLLTLWEL